MRFTVGFLSCGPTHFMRTSKAVKIDTSWPEQSRAYICLHTISLIPIIHTWREAKTLRRLCKYLSVIVRVFCYCCYFCFHSHFVYLFIRFASSRDLWGLCLGSANGFCFRSCLALHNAASMIITPKNKREDDENERKTPAEQIERRFALEPAPSSCPHSTLHS